MPPINIGECRAQHCVAILCVTAGGEGELRKDGRAENARYVGSRVHDEGLTGSLLGVKQQRDGNEQYGDGSGASLCWVTADESVRTVTGGMLEHGHACLRVCNEQGGDEKQWQTGGFDLHCPGSITRITLFGAKMRDVYPGCAWVGATLGRPTAHIAGKPCEPIRSLDARPSGRTIAVVRFSSSGARQAV